MANDHADSRITFFDSKNALMFDPLWVVDECRNVRLTAVACVPDGGAEYPTPRQQRTGRGYSVTAMGTACDLGATVVAPITIP
jgi:hypothetical protein